MTPDEFAQEMAYLSGFFDRKKKLFDPEEGHIKMDELMGKVLTQLGYGEGVAIYNSCEKWYS